MTLKRMTLKRMTFKRMAFKNDIYRIAVSCIFFAAECQSAHYIRQCRGATKNEYNFHRRVS